MCTMYGKFLFVYVHCCVLARVVVGNGRQSCALIGIEAHVDRGSSVHAYAAIMSDEEVIEVTVDISELKKLKVKTI